MANLVTLYGIFASSSILFGIEPSFIDKDWKFTSVDGKSIVWNRDAKAHVICFLGCECPVARFYAARLSTLYRQFEPEGIEFLGIMSNLHDSPEDVQKFAKELEIPFPLIHDGGQRIAREWKASRTAEVLVLDKDGRPAYRGRIDDQMAPGVKRSDAKQHELRDSLAEIVKSGKIAFRSSQPVGCLISFEKVAPNDATVTYTRDVAPIFNQHCYECHRRGDIGPFDISDFQEVRGWAEMIGEVISNRRMPPWHADNEHGKFRNARVMLPAEIDLIRRWVEAGSPYGNAKDLPPVPVIREGWRLPRDPDLIVSMRAKPYTIPPIGAVEYQYFVVDPQLKEDRWVHAAQVIPGNASIVHHAIVFIRPPDGEEIKGISWLMAFVPGQRPMVFPEGYARRVPAGSKFVFQMHYTPNGTEQSDITKIGMNFVEPTQVTHEVSTMIGIDQSFEIPPNASNHVIHGIVRSPRQDATLLAISPHMHLRGKSFQLRSQNRDGVSSTILDVPRYDFNWQHTYELAEPIRFAELDRLEFDVTFDNSSANPFNPDPAVYVMWGDQTWEEMAVAFFEVAFPREATPSVAPSNLARNGSPVSDGKEPSKDAFDWADAYLKRFDKDADGKIAKLEVNDLVRRYSFHLIDRDEDEVLLRDELARSFEARRGR